MQSHVRLIMVALVLLLLGSIPPLSEWRRELDRYFLMTQAQISLSLVGQSDRLQQIIRTADVSQLEILEQTNRALQAQNISMEERLRVAERTAQLASASASGQGVVSTLTKTLHDWAVLAGSEAGVRVGDVVTESGAYIGTISRVYPTWSTIRSITDEDFLLTVMIEGGGEGVLRSGTDTLVLRTQETSVSTGSSSAVLSIPDPLRRGERYPIGMILAKERREEILTTRRVRPIGRVAIGQIVLIHTGASQ